MKTVITILLSILIFTLEAQTIRKLEKKVDERKVTIQQDDVLVEAEIKLTKIRIKDNRMYTWYWKDTIISTIGNFEGIPLHGEMIVYNKNKILLSKTNFVKGIKHGKEYLWNEDGSLISINKWKKGTLKLPKGQTKIKKSKTKQKRDKQGKVNEDEKKQNSDKKEKKKGKESNKKVKSKKSPKDET